MTEIIVALIALIGTLCGSLGGVLVSSKMTNYRLLQLENKVAEHNTLFNFHAEALTSRFEINIAKIVAIICLVAVFDAVKS